MANLAAREPDYAGPDVATRYKAGTVPNPHGRPSIKWLRQKVETVDEKTGQNRLQQMADHLIEVSTSWEVRVIGRDSDGELLKVASARDSIEACRLLWQALSLVRKPPVSDEEMALQLAEHLRKVARDQIEIGQSLLGDRIKAMTDAQLAEFWRLCDTDPARFLLAAQSMLRTPDEERGLVEPLPRQKQIESGKEGGK